MELNCSILSIQVLILLGSLLSTTGRYCNQDEHSIQHKNQGAQFEIQVVLRGVRMNEQHRSELYRVEIDRAVATALPKQIDRIRHELERLLQDPRVAEQDKDALRRDPLLRELCGLPW